MHSVIRSAFLLHILHLAVHFFHPDHVRLLSGLGISKWYAQWCAQLFSFKYCICLFISFFHYDHVRLLSGLGISKCLTSDSLAPMRALMRRSLIPARGTFYWGRLPPRSRAIHIDETKKWTTKWNKEMNNPTQYFKGESEGITYRIGRATKNLSANGRTS